ASKAANRLRNRRGTQSQLAGRGLGSGQVSLQRVGACGVAAAQGRQMVAQRVPGNAAVMAAVEGRGQAEMRGAGLLPEPRLSRPIGLVAVAHRYPDLDADLARVASGLLGQPAQLPEDVERALVGR